MKKEKRIRALITNIDKALQRLNEAKSTEIDVTRCKCGERVDGMGCDYCTTRIPLMGCRYFLEDLLRELQ